MLRINPQRLKHWREKRNMSMADLADRSSVDKSTIFRIESGQAKTTRANVVGKIAKALNVPEKELTSEAEPVAEQHRRNTQDKSQVSFRLENRFRNAFAFVCWRYDINQTTILKLAPLLFVMVAEDSLRKRVERLSMIRSAQGNSEALPWIYRDAAERFEQDEERSIRSKDIFGLQLNDPSIQPLDFFKDVDWVGQCNPFEAYIKDWFERTGEAGGIDHWEEAGPHFSICSELALDFACGDEAMAMALLDGTVGLHEVPHELLDGEMAKQRLQWLQTRAAEARAQREERSRAFRETCANFLAKIKFVDTMSPEQEENR
ncbi:Helix-turn-helix transcriptional regulator (plasmid) [Rhodovastum atsumiense]|uniref:Helix-turn-helix transcriptional regulator n=1 Tax=Rhodovastum atsumiense TaxID=504468 RepID=A0A5M6IVB5_9PROT|nr:helix-turn-helix transcriptional regulator [Rhodovastum atsumiense]KAA5611787.1 helix-turn-helix transcriptional regulator [Rhodovastum atsumiense]CAH2606107.1 Helix-turn-helix transcriptional regulator [Rhodovastum atsumiense]